MEDIKIKNTNGEYQSIFPIKINQGGTGKNTENKIIVDLYSKDKKNIFEDEETKIGIKNILSVVNGGTGISTSPKAILNLNNNSTLQPIYNTNIEYGLDSSSVLQISNGGTGKNSNINLYGYLNLNSKRNLFQSNSPAYTGSTGILNINNGGTNASESSVALSNIGIKDYIVENNIWSSLGDWDNLSSYLGTVDNIQWFYLKYANGIALCHGSARFLTIPAVSYTPFTINLSASLPMEFAYPPATSINCSFPSDTTSGVYYIRSTTDSINFWVYRKYNTSTALSQNDALMLYFNVMGRWKE